MKAPVDMPDMYIAAQQFELQRNDFTAPEASGRIGGVQSGFPLWSMVATLTRMPEDYSDTWRAWLAGLRGATRRFVARDLSRPYPKAYPDGFSALAPFDGAAADWSSSINTDGDCELTLSLGSDAAGLVLSVGDYVDFRWTATETSIAGLDWRALVRVVEGATANGSGNVTVIVEPAVPSAVPDTAVAHLDQPGCTMALVSGQTNLGAVDRLYSIQGGTIVAVQDLRA